MNAYLVIMKSGAEIVLYRKRGLAEVLKEVADNSEISLVIDWGDNQRDQLQWAKENEETLIQLGKTKIKQEAVMRKRAIEELDAETVHTA